MSTLQLIENSTGEILLYVTTAPGTARLDLMALNPHAGTLAILRQAIQDGKTAAVARSESCDVTGFDVPNLTGEQPRECFVRRQSSNTDLEARVAMLERGLTNSELEYFKWLSSHLDEKNKPLEEELKKLGARAEIAERNANGLYKLKNGSVVTGYRAVDLYEDAQERVVKAERAAEWLQNWKKEVDYTMEAYDGPAIGKLLGIPPGEYVLRQIEPRIKALVERTESAEKRVLELEFFLKDAHHARERAETERKALKSKDPLLSNAIDIIGGSEVTAVLDSAAEKLGEVRTGEDFECECWTEAAKLRIMSARLQGKTPNKIDLDEVAESPVPEVSERLGKKVKTQLPVE